MKIVVGIPNGGSCTIETTLTVAVIAFHQGKAGHECVVLGAKSCYVDENRNELFYRAQKLNADWLLFVDTDSQYMKSDDILGKMMSQEKDVLTGVYYQGYFPHRPIVYKFTETGLVENYLDIPKGLFKCEACGGGWLLISKKVMDMFTPETIKQYGEPFANLYEDKKVTLHEDVAFCWRLKQLGVEIWADSSIQIEHIKTHGIQPSFFEAAKKIVQKSGDVVASGIPGWMTEGELAILGVLASKSKNIAEIGSWKGRSTKKFLELCQGTVYAIDHWNGTSTDQSGFFAKGEDVYAEFMKNVGHYPNLEVCKGYSAEMAKTFNNKKFDMVFIDADHSYEGCKADIEAWLPKCRKILAGHDYSPEFPGVVKAVAEKYKEINLCETVWWVEI